MRQKDNEIRKNIQTNLTELRKQNNLTQADIAKITGKARTAVASWEQGLSLPDLATLYRLSLYYHKTMEYFFENITTSPEGRSGDEVIKKLSIE